MSEKKKSVILDNGKAYSIGNEIPVENFSPVTGEVVDVKASTKNDPDTVKRSGFYIGVTVKDSDDHESRTGFMSSSLIGASVNGTSVPAGTALKPNALMGKVIDYNGTRVLTVRDALPGTEEKETEKKEENVFGTSGP